MLEKLPGFPVAQLGLGQKGILRQGSREYDQHGRTLQRAARLLRGRLDPSAGPELERATRRRTKPNPLRPKPASGKLEIE